MLSKAAEISDSYLDMYPPRNPTKLITTIGLLWPKGPHTLINQLSHLVGIR